MAWGDTKIEKENILNFQSNKNKEVPPELFIIEPEISDEAQTSE